MERMQQIDDMAKQKRAIRKSSETRRSGFRYSVTQKPSRRLWLDS
jgi:hypothetical protein